MNVREGFGGLIKERRQQKARDSLLKYCESVYPYRAGRVHKFIAAKLEAIERGELRRVCLSLPPQHGKTLLMQLFGCWFLGRGPERKAVIASYGDDRANDIGRAVLRVLRDDSRHHDIFPECEVDTNAASQSRTDLLAGGGFYAVGRGGSLTGRSADLLIVDDLLKDDREARSAIVRREVIEWYTRVALTRLAPNAPVILVGTRWGRGDLFDYVVEQCGDEHWDIVNLSAIAGPEDPLGRSEGQPLWGERYDTDVLAQRKFEVGISAWLCLYQGTPQLAEGAILKREWWQYYLAQPEKGFRRIILSADTAFKSTQTADFSVIQVWGETETGFYLLANWRQRVPFPTLKETLVSFASQWRPEVVLIEDAASGQSLIQELRASTSLPLRPVKVDRDKEARASSITAMLQAGRVFLPQTAPWLEEFLDECSSFPRAPHDDQVDACTQALIYLRGEGSGTCWAAQLGAMLKDVNEGTKSEAELAASKATLEQFAAFGAEKRGFIGNLPSYSPKTPRSLPPNRLKLETNCPSCGNPNLSGTSEWQHCNPCGWDLRTPATPPPEAKPEQTQIEANLNRLPRFLSARLGID